jgi:sporadic carbohydrate cluster protein (TIGR04323 family)
MGERVPQHVQNIVIRNYCNQNGLYYLLSSTEYVYDQSDKMLEQVLNEAKDLDGVVLYSLYQLPENNKKRERIYKFILRYNKELHFAVEGLKISKKTDIQQIEYLWLIKKVLPNCPQNLSFLNK